MIAEPHSGKLHLDDEDRSAAKREIVGCIPIGCNVG